MHAWHLVSRLGEAQILLPAAIALAAWLAWRADAPRLAFTWMLAMGTAAAITTVTKIAFIGFALGIPQINFTGISGHAMFSAAVYPLVFGGLATAMSDAARRRAIVLGVLLALLIGVSRVKIYAHSWSEVVLGLALGGLASATALWVARMPHVRMPWWVPALLVGWLLITPTQAPASRTHDWVTRLSLALSGRPEPYTRRAMLADWREQQRQEATSPPH
jgi:membrane-associated phospholipid phosphatase